MAAFNITTALASLGLSQVAAARLLSVDPRTLRRWVENPGEIPGPAEQALRAWVRLNQYGLPWSPDGVDLVELDPEQIARHRVHTIQLDELLEKVRERGGPSAPWVVDLRKCKATLEKAEVTFYRLRSGGFSPQTYSRRDQKPDLQRDWYIIEDALACIARAIASSTQC